MLNPLRKETGTLWPFLFICYETPDGVVYFSPLRKFSKAVARTLSQDPSFRGVYSAAQLGAFLQTLQSCVVESFVSNNV